MQSRQPQQDLAELSFETLFNALYASKLPDLDKINQLLVEYESVVKDQGVDVSPLGRARSDLHFLMNENNRTPIHIRQDVLHSIKDAVTRFHVDYVEAKNHYSQ